MAKRRKQQSLLPWTILLVLFTIIIVVSVIYALNRTKAADKQDAAPSVEPPRNTYRADAFYRDGDFLRYGDSDHMVGIDVSVHQGVIDWQKVADAGVEFAILRIGYRGSTVGELYQDEQFEYNFKHAKNAGIQIGVYFFSQAVTAEEATEEAEYVCSLLEGRTIDLPVYFDWELLDGRAENISQIPLTDCAVAFCDEMQAQGYRAGVYFNKSFGYDYFDLTKLQNYDLWLAEYNDVPTFRYHFDCLQYTDSAHIDGIESPVDLDLLIENKKTE